MRAQRISKSVAIAVGCATIAGCGVTPSLRTTVTEGPKLPVEVGGHAGGLVAGVPVVAGGSSWVGDPKTKRWRADCFVLQDGVWTPGPSLPDGLADAAYASDGTSLYLAGGVNGTTPTDRVLRLSSVDAGAQWEQLPPLPRATEAGSAAILNGTLYVLGGFAGGSASRALYSLDLHAAAPEWKLLEPLPGPGRAYAAMVATESALVVFGGFDAPAGSAEPTIFSDVFLYATDSNSWQRIQPLVIPGYAWTAMHVGGQQILLAGRVPQLSVISDEILLVDVAARQVRAIGRLVQGNCCMPGIPLRRDEWLLPGGEPDTNRTRSSRSSVVRIERG